MNIAISGATGFIGRHLTAFFTAEGHRVLPLGRTMFREEMSGHLIQTLAHCDVVINLAGASISHRWTPEYKREMYESRIQVTHRIIRSMEAVRQKPKLMISASAVGYYPLEGSFDEYTNTRGNGFLSDLCYAWEKEAKHCPSQTRLVITRFGIVLSPDGGAMEQMLKPMTMTKTAAVIGSGAQPFPWIDIKDLCLAMKFIMEHETLRGIVNLVAPQQVTQYTFTRALAKAYHAWATVKVPRVAFRLLYGDAASFLTTGQQVSPTRMLEAGFRFATPTLGQFFEKVDRSTVDELDLTRYMGLWYEVARFDHRFERGLTEVTATYTLLSDGTVRVENRGCKQSSPAHYKTAIGRAKMPDTSQPGKLKVSFFLCFYSDYYVLELDNENYSYALIGSSSDKYLWILSRTPQLPKEIKKKLLDAAMRRGYNPSQLLWIGQKITP